MMSAAESGENREASGSNRTHDEIQHSYTFPDPLPDPITFESRAREDTTNDDRPSRHSSDSMNSDLELEIMNHDAHQRDDEEAHLNGRDGKSESERNHLVDTDDEVDVEEEAWSWSKGLFYRDAMINLVLIGLW